jgi:FKBP-type peptidyl-prolyl cis-trans isomerase SlyD
MLKVEENRVVTFDYTLTDDSGAVLDTSENSEPLSYIHGSGEIIPGLEAELLGKTVGAKFKATIKPEDAYGLRLDDCIRKIPKEQLSHLSGIELGMQLQAYDEQGMQILTVVEIGDSEITLDANHPLAGQTLHFDVEIVEIRDATDEELAFGLHGCGSGCGTTCGDDCGCGGGCSC